MPDKTEKKQGKFRKGHSGNPLGRPRGTRNKAAIAGEALIFKRSNRKLEENCLVRSSQQNWSFKMGIIQPAH